MTLRETFTSALAGPLGNARATSAGVAPCAPPPGSSRMARGSSRRASPTARGCVAPMTAPTAERPCSPTRSAPHSATSSATWRQTVCRLEEGGGVGAGGRPDIAALSVRDDLQPGRARVRAHVLEGADTIGSKRLEKGGLGLHANDVRRNGVDESAAEPGARTGSLCAAEVHFAFQLDREEIGPRIEPDHELRALPLDRLGEAVGGVRRRACRPAA